LLDLTILEMVLLATVIAAACINFYFGRSNGIEIGMKGTLEYLVNDGTLSRFVNKEGNIDFCSRGIMNDICPKCGFHEGDNLGEQET